MEEPQRGKIRASVEGRRFLLWAYRLRAFRMPAANPSHGVPDKIRSQQKNFVQLRASTTATEFS